MSEPRGAGTARFGGGPGWDAAELAARLAGCRLGRALVVRDQVGSTNDVAWERAESGEPEGLVVLAESQTRGRGRGGSAWFSPPGVGVWVSYLLRPELSPRAAGLLPLAAGLAAARAAERQGVPAGLKWPNDLVAADGSGRKLGGVLTESRREESGRWTVVVGVGVNVNAPPEGFPTELRPRAAALSTVAGRGLSRAEFLVGLTRALGEGYEALERGEECRVVDDWKERAVMFGRAVSVRGGGAAVQGIARDLAGDGALIVRLDSGAELEVRAGQLEVVWQGGGEGG